MLLHLEIVLTASIQLLPTLELEHTESVKWSITIPREEFGINFHLEEFSWIKMAPQLRKEPTLG
jgi:hypothetical protein